MLYRTTYKVRPVSKAWADFPIDMLRYDSSFPATETDASTIARTFAVWEPGEEDRTEVELVHLGENRDWRPTAGRWGSFDWSVTGPLHTEALR